MVNMCRKRGPESAATTGARNPGIKRGFDLIIVVDRQVRYEADSRYPCFPDDLYLDCMGSSRRIESRGVS
jgi:hypothetical protein